MPRKAQSAQYKRSETFPKSRSRYGHASKTKETLYLINPYLMDNASYKGYDWMLSQDTMKCGLN